MYIACFVHVCNIVYTCISIYVHSKAVNKSAAKFYESAAKFYVYYTVIVKQNTVLLKQYKILNTLYSSLSYSFICATFILVQE